MTGEIMTTTSPDTMETLAAQIRVPYTLTPGEAVGIFIAELANRKLIASRHGATITVPAQDFDGADGAPADEFLEVAPVGVVTSFTSTSSGTFAYVQIDGTDTNFVHRLIGVPDSDLEIGLRVEAVWADEPTGTMLDLAGFGPERAAESFAPRQGTGLLAPIERIDYTMTLDYQHAYGHYYGTLFDGIKNDRRIRGVKCSECRRVLLPPREFCDVCYAPTSEWVDVPAVGTIQASSVVHIEFIGQRLKPPYVYAEIVLDGTNTRLIHMVGNVDPDEAKTVAAPGARVRAVWSDRRTGSLADIEYFETFTTE
jgi:uncharacterized OB-fold protein